MTAPSTSSTNDINTAIPVYEVSTASPNVNIASPQVNTASFSDNTVYAFMVENPNGSNLLQTGKNIFINVNDTARNQDNTRKQGNNEDTSSKAMLAIDGVGFDWSDMAEEQVQKNMDLMAFSDYECDDLIINLNQTEFIAATYKRGLATVEQIITYRKNEVLSSEEVAVLKREVACKDYEINVLKSEFEKVKQEKKGIEFKIEKFDKALKDLDKLLGSQITNNSKKGLGYSAVPPPHPLIYNRHKKLDLSYSGLDEFKEPEFKGYYSENSKQESNIVCDQKSDDSKENYDYSLVKEQVSKDISSIVESSLNVDKETIFPVDKKVEFVKPKNYEKLVKKSVRVNYNYTTKRTHPNAQRNMVPRAFLIKTGLKQFNTARTVNTAYPKSTVFSAKPMSRFPKIAQSTVRRPFQSKTALSNKRFTNKVNIAKAQAVNTARPQAVNTARPKAVKTARLNFVVVKAVRVNQANGKPQQDDTRFVGSRCSRHMTGNIAYLLDFKEIYEGYVTFGGGAHGGRISGKGTLKTNSLDFEDVYFVNELKFNLFSVSQMCDKKNYVLFTLNNIVPKESLSCLVAKATLDESMLWHRRLGKQHRASCKSKVLNPITKPLFMLHMDLFGPTFDETSKILKNFIKEIENLMDKKVKIFRSDNETEFKNKVMDDFCREKGIKREYSIARTPQQNCVAERRNRTLIEVAKTMLADSKLPTTFWAKAVILLAMYRIWLSTIINQSAVIEGELNVGTSEEISQDCIVMPIWKDASYFDLPSKDVDIGEPKSAADDQKQVEDGLDNENDEKDKSDDDSSPKEVNAAGQHVNTASPDVNTGSFKLNTVDPSVNTASSYDQDSPKDMFIIGASHTLEATHVEFFSDKDEPEVNLGNITNSYTVPTTPNTRIHKDHLIENVIGDVKSSVQTRRMKKPTFEQGFLSAVWILVDLPIGKRAIGTKWVFRNKKDKRGIMIRNKAMLVAQGHRQEEGIDYEEFFAHVAIIKAIRLFLAYASFMGFLVYQMDVMSAFLYGTIEEEAYVIQPLGFKDPDHPNKVYKVYVDDIIFGSTNKDLCTAFEKLMKHNFQMSSMGELTFFLGLKVQQKEDGIFISHDKYVAGILKKFNYIDVKSASTLVDLEKPLVKDGDADDLDVYLYRSMIGSLMYLTTSKPDIMFAVYLKGKPTLGLSYSRDSPFELVAYTDSDYTRATQDRKSTTGGSQFLGNRHVKRGRDTKIPQSSGPPVKVGDEVVHKELGGRMERAATTASSLEAEQDSGNINRTQSMAILNGSSP
ncbi:putative ribonuclease H-like domain-containing protein [Tanacetum coccineum]